MRLIIPVITHLLIVFPLYSQWPISPDSAIYVGYGSQKQVVEDGQGGVYIVYGSTHAYCTRINHEGQKIWEAIPLDGDYPETIHNSVALATDSSLLVSYSNILYIGSFQTGDAHIRVQKISPNGEKLWGDGVVVTPDNASGSFDEHPHLVGSKVVADDSGGAYVAWTDMRNDPPGSVPELYAQRLNSAGEIMWDSLGILIDDRVERISHLAISSTNQILLTFLKLNTNFVYQSLAQLIDQDGTILLQDGSFDFNVNPITHYTLNSGDQIVYTSRDDKVFKVNLDFEYLWPVAGITISDSSDFIWDMVTDQNGGVILQYQKDDTSHEMFSQWIENDGTLKYGPSGLFVTTSDVEYVTTTMSDPESFIVTYQDWYNYTAQRIDSGGNLLWPDNTLIHSNNHYTSHWQESVSDTDGGIICVFDYNYSTYAAQMGQNGDVGSLTSISERYRNRARPTEFTLATAYPNPFNSVTILDVYSNYTGQANISIYNLKGANISAQTYQVVAGRNNLAINFLSLKVPSGQYLIKIWQRNNPEENQYVKACYVK